MLQETESSSCTPSVHPPPLGMCHFLLEWQLEQLTSALSFNILHHSSAPLHGMKKKRGKKKHTCILKDQTDLIRSHAGGCYGNGQFWPSGCRGLWCIQVIELQSWGLMGAETAPECLPAWENDWPVQPTLHTPAKPFWWKVATLHSDEMLCPPPSPQHALVEFFSILL